MSATGVFRNRRNRKDTGMTRSLPRRMMVGVTAVAFLAGAIAAFLVVQWPSRAPAVTQMGDRPITTTGLFLTNHKGEIRASLTLWDEEHPALVLGDKHCERRASLIVSPRERATLTMFGEDCKRRAALEIQPDDEPAFTLRDHHDVPRARISLLPTGRPQVHLYDENGATLWKAP